MDNASGKRRFHKIAINKSSVFELDVRYKNLKPVGSGSYGLVCAADDTLTGTRVAIKKVADVFEDLVDAKRILREIKLLAHLGSHENVVDIKDIMTLPHGTKDFKDLYIVTDLFECDLDRIVSSSQELTDAHHQYFLYQLLRGLKFIHSANVLHRDLKPSNLLVNSNCDLAICDFGLARGVPEGEDMLMTDYVVTRWYRAPELLCDNQVYDKKVDVWSAGLIFAELLVRRPLLQGKDYLDQLRLIVKLLGRPSEKDMEHLAHATAKKALREMGKERADTRPFERIFRKYTTNADAIDLLKKMLVFNPNKRCTVEEALAHPYLADLHQEGDEPECTSGFDYSFEEGYPEEMPKKLLQSHMYKQMLEVIEKYKGAAKAGAPKK